MTASHPRRREPDSVGPRLRRSGRAPASPRSARRWERKVSLKLPDRIGGKPLRMLQADIPVVLPVPLAVPVLGKLLHDPGCLPSVQIERISKGLPLSDRGQAMARADTVGEFAIDVVAQRLSEEIAEVARCDGAKL